jgi:nicotinamide mononucleotide adenylyltransferase
MSQCRKPLIWYNVDPDKRFKNKKKEDDFDEKISKYSIEDITFNKLSLMILRDYFEAFFKWNQKNLGWNNFNIKIANNYDNVMGGSHLIVGFTNAKTYEKKHFVLHINTQWSHKKIPKEIIPFDFSSTLDKNGKTKPINMTMKSLDWGNKELFYKFIWNAIETIKKEGNLDWENAIKAFENAGWDKSVEHIKHKIIELLSENPSLAA